jgi:choline monooxygenase
MSDLSLQLQQAASQLSVHSYFDPSLFRREVDLLFQRGPRYVGHSIWVPAHGDYYALPQEGGGRALVRTPNGVDLISNVCRHRQAIILKGKGSIAENRAAGGNIVCPLHRWTYSAGNSAPAGTLLGAPHFAEYQLLNLDN